MWEVVRKEAKGKYIVSSTHTIHDSSRRTRSYELALNYKLQQPPYIQSLRCTMMKLHLKKMFVTD
jgi:hypothetical protein